MSNQFNQLWVEKHRPQTLDDMCISEKNRKTIEEWKESQEIPHLLLLGTSGIGKTTITRIIVNEILNCDYLYINASDESGIETIRTKVSGFVQTKSMDGKIKIVILDEGDRLTKSSLDCLRNLMESYANNSRFIITGNYAHKITDAINSRCRKLDLTPSRKDIGKRCLGILQKEGISTKGITKEKFNHLINTYYPDIRKCIYALQTHIESGKLVLDDSEGIDELCGEIVKSITNNKTLQIRKSIIEAEESFSSDYTFLLKTLLKHIYNGKIKETLKKQYILVITEYLYRSAFVDDKEINCFACILQMEDITS